MVGSILVQIQHFFFFFLSTIKIFSCEHFQIQSFNVFALKFELLAGLLLEPSNELTRANTKTKKCAFLSFWMDTNNLKRNGASDYEILPHRQEVPGSNLSFHMKVFEGLRLLQWSAYQVTGCTEGLKSERCPNVNPTPSACGRIMSSVYDKNVGIIAKHTWTPCWLKWAERCQRTPLSCPPNSWSRGPASPERQMLWLHSRTGPSETSTEVYCLHTLWCQILGRNTPYFTDIDRGVLSSYFMMSILGAEHSVLYRADMHA